VLLLLLLLSTLLLLWLWSLNPPRMVEEVELEVEEELEDDQPASASSRPTGAPSTVPLARSIPWLMS
jgi:hypothetical protein